MNFKPVLLVAMLCGISLPAMADTDTQARQHFQAIADADVTAITQDYAPDAVFQWVGGPLDGVYAGTQAIGTVWGKFTRANGRVTHQVDDLTVSENPKGATVTANVDFMSKKNIKVRYILTYRDGKLVNEVWQVDPKRVTSSY